MRIEDDSFTDQVEKDELSVHMCEWEFSMMIITGRGEDLSLMTVITSHTFLNVTERKGLSIRVFVLIYGTDTTHRDDKREKTSV